MNTLNINLFMQLFFFFLLDKSSHLKEIYEIYERLNFFVSDFYDIFNIKISILS